MAGHWETEETVVRTCNFGGCVVPEVVRKRRWVVGAAAGAALVAALFAIAFSGGNGSGKKPTTTPTTLSPAVVKYCDQLDSFRKQITRDGVFFGDIPAVLAQVEVLTADQPKGKRAQACTDDLLLVTQGLDPNVTTTTTAPPAPPAGSGGGGSGSAGSGGGGSGTTTTKASTTTTTMYVYPTTTTTTMPK